jgi:hypothetical protein
MNLHNEMNLQVFLDTTSGRHVWLEGFVTAGRIDAYEHSSPYSIDSIEFKAWTDGYDNQMELLYHPCGASKNA